jgi:anti-sigma factor RsiW
MMLRRHRDQPGHPALARLADGTASADERAALEDVLAGRPELAAELAEQRDALTLLASIAAVTAPPGLQERVRASQAQPARRRPRATRRAAILAIAFVAVVLVALVRSSGTANVHSVVAVALARGDTPPPGVSPRDHVLLGIAIDRVAFPNWADRGWRTSGSRLDSLGGQEVETVYYRAEGYERLGYSIVGGAPLAIGGARLLARHDGVSYWTIAGTSASVVTWRRDGHTCVLASRAAPLSALVALAETD